MKENKLVYIASPYAGDTKSNTEFARDACRCCIAEGHTPVAPHLLYTQMLDDTDPAQRRAGLDLGLRLLKLADELWVCGGRTSPGMAAEIREAEKLGIPVRRIQEADIYRGSAKLNDMDTAVLTPGGIRMVMD